jgi:hypothetical protein
MHVQRIRRTFLISTSKSEFFLQCGLYHRTRHSRGIEREATTRKQKREPGKWEGRRSEDARMGWGSRRERSWGEKERRNRRGRGVEMGRRGRENRKERERENKQWMARRGTERLRWGIR